MALELTMRDALEGLEELASMDTYWFDPGCLEILSIETPDAAAVRAPATAALRGADSPVEFPGSLRRTLP